MSDNRHSVRRIFRYAAIGLAAALVVLLALIGVQALFHEAPHASVRAIGDAEGPPAISDAEFVKSLELMTGAELKPGNQVEIMTSGQQTYPELWRSMQSARRSLTVQLYYILPGHLADSLFTILADRARAGVSTYLLHDAIGSSIPDSAVAVLRSAGVHVATFRPVKWWTLHKAQNRSHVRAVIIDGVTGFTGGFGIDDRWAGDGHHKDQWRDTNVRFQGPAVRQLQAAFDRAWTEATGQLLIGELFFPLPDSAAPAAPAPSAATGVTAGLLHSVATLGPTANARMLALTIAGAQRTLFISNAYFVPDVSMLQRLADASKRGVDVRLLLPGEDTDVPLTRWAARSWYERLIRSGVKVYEYQPSMLHAKTLVVDGEFASIGSMNLDFRSLALNDEATLLIADRAVGARMDSLYMDDLRYSRAIDLAKFQRRGLWQKMRERFARAIGRLL